MLLLLDGGQGGGCCAQMRRSSVEVGEWFGILEIADVALASIRHSSPSKQDASSLYNLRVVSYHL